MLKKMDSTFFAFIFALLTILLANTTYAANTEAFEQEIVELRGSNYKVYQLEEGKLGYKFYATDVHFKDKDNKYIDIDTSITDVSGTENIKSGFKYKNKANNWDVYFGNNKDNMMKIVKDKYTITSSILSDDDSTDITVEKSADVEISKKIKDIIYNNTVIYQDVFPYTHISYTIGNTYVKEVIVVERYTGNLEYTFRISLNGLDLIEKDNLLYLVDEDTKECVFEITPVYIEDSVGHSSYEGSLSYQYDQNDILLTINLPESFMTSPDTVYPVLIDPTFKGSASTRDTFVACKCSNPSACACTVSSCSCNKNYNSSAMGDNFYKLRVGKDTAYGVRRTYIDFDNVYATVNGMQIVSATLNFYFASTDGGARNIRAYALSSWLSGTISRSMTWKTKLGYYEATESDTGTLSPGGTSISINVEGILQYWANSSVNNANGFLVKDDNESDTSVWSTLYSSDYSDTTKIPYLYVTTTTRPSLNQVDVKLMYDVSFAYWYNDATDARIYLVRAGYPFAEKWNILLYPASVSALYGLPSDYCKYSTSYVKCDADCGDKCINDDSSPNHCKNAYRIFDITNDYPLAGKDLQVLFLAQMWCYNSSNPFDPYNWPSNHGGIWGLSLGDYVVIPFDARNPNPNHSIATVTHEISHNFGCHDHDPYDPNQQCSSGQRCCMKNSFQFLYLIDPMVPDIWCDNCEMDFNRLAQ